jgi:hypothetical protein
MNYVIQIAGTILFTCLFALFLLKTTKRKPTHITLTGFATLLHIVLEFGAERSLPLSILSVAGSIPIYYFSLVESNEFLQKCYETKISKPLKIFIIGCFVFLILWFGLLTFGS